MYVPQMLATFKQKMQFSKYCKALNIIFNINSQSAQQEMCVFSRVVKKIYSSRRMMKSSTGIPAFFPYRYRYGTK